MGTLNSAEVDEFLSQPRTAQLVTVPHTIYMKTLHRVAGQDDCRHHVVWAAVIAASIAEVKPVAGPVSVDHRGASSTEHGPFRQR